MNKLEKDLLSTIKEAYNLTDKEHNKVLKQYKKSQDNILQFIIDLIIKHGIDGKLDYDTYLRHHAKDIEQYMTQQVRNVAKEEVIILAVVLESVLNHTYNKSSYYLEQNLKTSVNFNLLRKGQIDTILNYNWSGIPFEERIWGNTDHLVRQLRQTLADGLKNGESIDKMAKRIKKEFNTKAYESKRLIRTESARVIDEATIKSYKDSGVVEKVQFTATLDHRTSKTCQGLDGTEYRLDDEKRPKIPEGTHINCRSCYIGIPYDGYKSTVRRDNVTKKIIPYQTYSEWIKNQSS